MSLTIKYILMVLSFLAFVITSAWFYSVRGFEPAAAAVSSLIAFISLFFAKTTPATGKIAMRQKGGKKSKLFQSGGDMNINK